MLYPRSSEVVYEVESIQSFSNLIFKTERQQQDTDLDAPRSDSSAGTVPVLLISTKRSLSATSGAAVFLATRRP